MMNVDEYKDINPDNIHMRIEAILSEKEIFDREFILKAIFSYIDLTSLEGSDTNEKIAGICEKAIGFGKKEKDIPGVAAVCFYPVFVKLAKEKLKGTEIHVASVAGAFPSGQAPLNIRLDEVKFALDEGADEIDMVISRGKFLEGNYQYVFDEIAAHKAICGPVHLKVILETGELNSLRNVRIASDIAMEAGADFIKTSTGKISPAATMETFLVMLEAIKDFHAKTGKMIGIKAAGGIADADAAIGYYLLTEAVLGQQWLDKKYFRIGASRLADKIINEITQ